MSMRKPESENDLLRTAYRDYWQGYREHTNSPDWPRNGQYPPVPDANRSLTCGAKTRAGTPCKRIDLYWSGRCKFHGGLSTGPLTEVGKAKARENGKLGGRGHVRKPDPMETPRKPQGGALIPGPSGGSTEANPMETARKRQGLVGSSNNVAAIFPKNGSPATDGRTFGPETPVSQPNPMESSVKLTFHGERKSVPMRTGNLIKPDLLNVQNGNVSVRVQCRDCAKLSAGFRCLSPGSSQTAPALGEWRECSYFSPI